jgi:opacity protein-like surface antigen
VTWPRGARLAPVVLLAVILGSSLAAPAAFAQVPAGRVEVSGGAAWVGAMAFPSVASEQVTSGGGRRLAFNTRTTLDASVGPSVSVGVRLSRLLTIEGGLLYSPTSLTTAITNDVEGVSNTSVETSVTQYLFEGGLVARLERWRVGRIAPYVTGGAGYVRQLYEDRVLLETGQAFYAGGGLYYERSSSPRSALKATGLRADVRALVMRDGVAPDSRNHVAPRVTVSFFARF